MIIYFKIFEKSTLNYIGIPTELIKPIQKNYEIGKDATWDKIKTKQEIIDILKNSKENQLFIQKCSDDISIFVLYIDFDDRYYFIDRYILNEDDEWGGSWTKKDRLNYSFNQIIKMLEKSCEIYQLKNSTFKTTYKEYRKKVEVQKEFEDYSTYFKNYVLDNFDRILKKSFGLKSSRIKDTIIENISKMSDKLSLDDIETHLTGEIEKIKTFKKDVSKIGDPFYLKNKEIKDNSLTVFDEYIIKFEEEYSKIFGQMLFIQDMVNKWSIDRVVTAFLYFIYSGKTIKMF